MADSGQFYMNGETLISSSSIFLDVALTIIAPNGYYSDGIWVRQQINGILQPPVPCPSCLPPCDADFTVHGAGVGIYNLDVNVGDELGAILITFDPSNIPDGILAVYNGYHYNSVSSSAWGFRRGDTFSLPTFLGVTANDCGIGDNTFTLPIFNYQNGIFVPTGNSDTIYVPQGQVKLASVPPRKCLMVIPKTLANPMELNIKIYGVCNGTNFDLEVNCPTILQSFAGTVRCPSIVVACNTQHTQTYYNAPVTGTPGHVGLHDFVFSDKYGRYPLTAGYYKITNQEDHNGMLVDEHGVVVGFFDC